MRGTPVVFNKFGGGLNVASSPYQLEQDEARDLLNVVSTERGAIRKRDGIVEFSTPSVSLHSLHAMLAEEYLVGVGGTSLYRISPDGSVSTFAAGLLTADERWDFIEAPATGGQGPVYGSNGVDSPRYFTGAASGIWTAASGTLPNGKYLAYHGNRVWAAGMDTFGAVSDPGSALAFSDIGDPRTWPAENVVLFDPGDGDAIQGIGRVGPYLIVFKTRKAWIVYDLDTGANRPLGEGVGCVSHRSIVESQLGTFFLSADQGVMLTTGESMRRVSDRVRPLLDDIPAAQRQAAAGVWHRGHYYLAFSSGVAYNDRILDYDSELESWWLHGARAQQPVVWTDDLDLYAPRGDVAAVDQLFVSGTNTDLDAAMPAHWSGPWHDFNTSYRKTRVRELHFDGLGRIQVKLSRDFRAAAELWGDESFSEDAGAWETDDGSLWGVDDGSLWGAIETVGEARILTPGVARAWSVTFGNETVDPFEVDSYTFAITGRKD